MYIATSYGKNTITYRGEIEFDGIFVYIININNNEYLLLLLY